jgi:hypothetical protein
VALAAARFGTKRAHLRHFLVYEWRVSLFLFHCCLDEIPKSVLVVERSLLPVVEMSLADSADFSYFLHFVHTLRKMRHFPLYRYHITLCSRVDHPTALLLTLCLLHVDVGSIEIVFGYFGIIVENSKLIVLL